MKTLFQLSPWLLPAVWLAGCAHLPFQQPGLVGTEWELVSLADHAGSIGAGGPAPILTLDATSQRAAGFAGCNRYFAGYELAGASIRFSAPGATRMLCRDGMALEQSFLASLPLITSYAVADGRLTLSAGGKPLAVFRAK